MNIDLRQLTNELLREVIDGTVIEGGHYYLHAENNGTVTPDITLESKLTFEAAVLLYSVSADLGFEVALSFLVDDFPVPSVYRQKHNAQFRLAPEYEDILLRHRIDPGIVLFFFESRLRNRANNRIRSAVKKGKVINTGVQFQLNPDKLGITDRISSINMASRPVPNCRMILGQELQDKELLGFNKSINFCNSDVYACRGRYAAVYHTLLEGKMDVVNVYFTRQSKEHIDLEVQMWRTLDRVA